MEKREKEGTRDTRNGIRGGQRYGKERKRGGPRTRETDALAERIAGSVNVEWCLFMCC